MLPFALMLAVQVPAIPTTWYGPETATFNFAFAGNPYDSEKTDVRVQFIDGKGKRVERLAYFDAEEMAWKAVLVAEAPGKYRPVMFRNGVEVDAVPDPEIVELEDKPNRPGFVRIDPDDARRFRLDDGKPYMPLGFNLAWQSASLPDMTAMLRTMGQNGVNWSRIWACSWDGKNPWVGRNGESDEDRMLPASFARWDELVKAAEESGIAFQFVLFHHGSFSSTVNPNWGDHPWNKAKGGFLEKAADFFTDKEANRRAKMWLRYAVARWGHSSSVMAWELFNEVEWVDARYANRWGDVLSWHKEFADYLRTIDPYRHLVATSSTFELENLYQAVDFYQPHIYPPDVRTAIAEFKDPGDKPLFFGEYGPGALGKKGQRMDVRDGIWAGILSGHAGAGAFWSWDVVHGEGLYSEYKTAAKILAETGFVGRKGLNKANVRTTTAGRADMTFNPGTGWGKSEKIDFAFESGTRPAGLGLLSSYLQGPAKRDLFPGPLKFRFRAPRPGNFTLQLSEISKLGAQVQFRLNGKQVADKSFPAGERNTQTSERFLVPYPAGSNEIEIENVGADWVNMRSFTFSEMDYEAYAQSIRAADWLMARVTAVGDAKPAAVDLSALALPPGIYSMTVYDLETGASTTRSTTIAGLDHRESVAMPSRDVLLEFRIGK